jgi:hypothetical protein
VKQASTGSSEEISTTLDVMIPMPAQRTVSFSNKSFGEVEVSPVVE